MVGALLWAALVFYGLGIVLTLPSVVRRRPALSLATLCALGVGLVSHTGSIQAGAAHLHRLPVTDVHSALSFFSFLVTLAFFFAYLRYRITSLSLFMLPVVFLLTLVSAVRPGSSFGSAAFRGGGVLVHVSSTIFCYPGVFLSFVVGILFLIQEKELESKKARAF